MRLLSKNHGVTLLELVVTAAIGGAVILAAMQLTRSSQQAQLQAEAREAIVPLEDSLSGEIAVLFANYFRAAGPACTNAGLAAALTTTLSDGVQVSPLTAMPNGKIGGPARQVIEQRCLVRQTHIASNVNTEPVIYTCLQLRPAPGSTEASALAISVMQPLFVEFFFHPEDPVTGAAMPCNTLTTLLRKNTATPMVYFHFYLTLKDTGFADRAGIVPLAGL